MNIRECTAIFNAWYSMYHVKADALNTSMMSQVFCVHVFKRVLPQYSSTTYCCKKRGATCVTWYEALRN